MLLVQSQKYATLENSLVWNGGGERKNREKTLVIQATIEHSANVAWPSVRPSARRKPRPWPNKLTNSPTDY